VPCAEVPAAAGWVCRIRVRAGTLGLGACVLACVCVVHAAIGACFSSAVCKHALAPLCRGADDACFDSVPRSPCRVVFFFSAFSRLGHNAIWGYTGTVAKTAASKSLVLTFAASLFVWQRAFVSGLFALSMRQITNNRLRTGLSLAFQVERKVIRPLHFGLVFGGGRADMAPLYSRTSMQSRTALFTTCPTYARV
jgi:hypothetical protein